MSTIVNDTIDQYFGHRTIYEDFSGLIYVRALNEMYHVSDMCNSAISDICCNIDAYSANYTYTGWNIINAQCIKLNNVEKGHPIFLRRINDPTSMDALSIKDRTYSENDILLTINDAYDRDDKLQYDLHHELLHALQMYIGDRNYIEKQKTRINMESEKDLIAQLHLSGNMLKIFNYLIYFSSASEQDAHINATIPYLKDQQIVLNKQVSNRIIDLVKESDDLNGFSQYTEHIEILNRWWTNAGALLNNILVLGYFFKKYSGDKKANRIKISKEDLKNINHMSDDAKEAKCGVVYDLVMEKYEQYKKRLFSTIMVHCLSLK